MRDGEVGDLLEAAKINSVLWGGRNNPMIPVGGSKSLTKRLIRLFGVDCLFKVDDSMSTEWLEECYPHFFEPIRRHRMRFFDPDWRSERKHPEFLDIINIIEHVSSNKQHALGGSEQEKHVMLKWDSDDPDANILTLSFGAFPESGSIFERAYLKGLGAEEIHVSKSDTIEPVVFQNQSLMGLTVHDMWLFRTTDGAGDGLYVGDAGSFEDLSNFWNLRAAGVYVKFCNVNERARWDQCLREHLMMLDKQSAGGTFANNGIYIYYSGCAEENLDKLQESLGVTKPFCRYRMDEVGGHGFDITQHQPYFQEGGALGNVEQWYTKHRVSVVLPGCSFMDSNSGSPSFEHFVAEFEPVWEGEYPLHTLKLPYLIEFTEALSREVAPGGDMNLQLKGTSHIISEHYNSVSMYPIAYDKLVEKIFGHRGVKAEISQPGIIAKRIIEQLGELGDARVFKIRGVRKLIKSLNTNDSVTKEEAVQGIYDLGTFQKFEDLYIEQRKSAKLAPQDAFRFLLKKGMFRGGLDFRCDNCKLSNWLVLRQIDDFWICEYCGRKHRTSVFLTNGQSKWQFRKSGLLGKDNHQEGAIPVIMTMLQFQASFHLRNCVFTPSMNLSFDDFQCESDLCILQYETQSERSPVLPARLEIGIGECKDENGVIDEEDIKRLRRVYEKLKGENIECYLIFSKTADAFGDDEIKLFKELKADRIPMILFTNKELEPYDPWETYKNEQSGHPFTLQEMATLTSKRHLS